MSKKLFLLLCALCAVFELEAKTVQYEFDIAEKTVNFTGKPVQTIAINQHIPAPLIEARVGDLLEVTFHNHLKEPSLIHWHGVLLPNDQDGVPYLTTPPIQPGASFTYRYPITHAGTYWYHSHVGLQEQKGIYGPLIFHPQKEEAHQFTQDRAIIFSDWTNESPEQVITNLKKDGDYYALKKDTVQSWWKILKHGKNAFQSRLRAAWSRMGPMDLSDVGYDVFLANGEPISYLEANPGDQIKLRFINAGASTYFNIEFAGGDLQLIAADGMPIEPIFVKRLRMAIAETYDVLIQLPPESKQYELRASSEDGTGYSSIFIGPKDQERVLAPTLPKPNLMTMSHDHGSAEHHHMHSTNMNARQNQATIPYLTDYTPLKSPIRTHFNPANPTREVTLNLTGNMEHYVWSFNHQTLLESSQILIKKGETVRFILNNETMMHHPIHLHGHFFRVLNGQGDWSPLKHTVNVPPMGKVEIEFEANEEKDWFFHCHNLYHMKSGMARIVSYEETSQATEEIIQKLAHDPWYIYGDAALLSNMNMSYFKFSNTRNSFEIKQEFDYEKSYDIDFLYSRRLNRFFDLYLGINLERGGQHEAVENTGMLGARYQLPLLIEADLRLDTERHVRLELASDLQLLDRLKFEWFANTDREFRTGLAYEITKQVLLVGHYDSDDKWGAGLKIRF